MTNNAGFTPTVIEKRYTSDVLGMVITKQNPTTAQVLRPFEVSPRAANLDALYQYISSFGKITEDDDRRDLSFNKKEMIALNISQLIRERDQVGMEMNIPGGWDGVRYSALIPIMHTRLDDTGRDFIEIIEAYSVPSGMHSVFDAISDSSYFVINSVTFVYCFQNPLTKERTISHSESFDVLSVGDNPNSMIHTLPSAIFERLSTEHLMSNGVDVVDLRQTIPMKGILCPAEYNSPANYLTAFITSARENAIEGNDIDFSSGDEYMKARTRLRYNVPASGSFTASIMKHRDHSAPEFTLGDLNQFIDNLLRDYNIDPRSDVPVRTEKAKAGFEEMDLKADTSLSYMVARLLTHARYLMLTAAATKLSIEIDAQDMGFGESLVKILIDYHETNQIPKTDQKNTETEYLIRQVVADNDLNIIIEYNLGRSSYVYITEKNTNVKFSFTVPTYASSITHPLVHPKDSDSKAMMDQAKRIADMSGFNSEM